MPELLRIVLFLACFGTLWFLIAAATRFDRRRALDVELAKVLRSPNARPAKDGVEVTIDGRRFTLTHAAHHAQPTLRIARHGLRVPHAFAFAIDQTLMAVGRLGRVKAPSDDPALVTAWQEHALGDVLSDVCSSARVSRVALDDDGVLTLELWNLEGTGLADVKRLIAGVETFAGALERAATKVDAKLFTVGAGVEVPRGSAASSASPVAIPVRRDP